MGAGDSMSGLDGYWRNGRFIKDGHISNCRGGVEVWEDGEYLYTYSEPGPITQEDILAAKKNLELTNKYLRGLKG